MAILLAMVGLAVLDQFLAKYVLVEDQAPEPITDFVSAHR